MEYIQNSNYILFENNEEDHHMDSFLDPILGSPSAAQVIRGYVMRNFKDLVELRRCLTGSKSEVPNPEKEALLLNTVNSFVSFTFKTASFEVSKELIREFVKLKVEKVPSNGCQLFDLFSQVLYKYLKKNEGSERKSDLFKQEDEVLLFCIIVLKLALSQKKDLRELKNKIFSDELFWNEVHELFFRAEIDELKNQWKKLLRKYSEKQNWKKEEVQLLSEIVRRFKTKKVWKKIATLLSKESHGRFKRNGKQCSEKWKNVMNVSDEKHIWTKEEDIKLLNLLLDNGCAWKKLAGLMKVRSKYSLIRRYKKILRKYHKSFVPNTKEITQEARKLLSIIIANLQGDKVFFCPLFYKKHTKKSTREIKKANSTSSFSTAASSPSSTFGQYPKVVLNSPSFSGRKEEKQEPCLETPEGKRLPKEEATPTQAFSTPIYEDFSQIKPYTWSFEGVMNNNHNNVGDNFFPKNIYEIEECSHIMQPSNEVLISNEGNQDAYNYYIKQCLINKFEYLHQEMKNTFKPENFMSHTPAKPLQHNFHNISDESLHFNYNPRNFGRISNHEICNLNIYCEADEMITRWHHEEF